MCAAPEIACLMPWSEPVLFVTMRTPGCVFMYSVAQTLNSG
jgi:hypothetical protein